MRPIIALTGDSMVAPSPVINLNYADMAPNMIKNAIVKVGGAPLILPYPEDDAVAETLAQQYVAVFDGLVLPGGPDVDPTFYHEEPIQAMGRATYQKDRFEIALIKATLKARKPIFAICRGIQILNVALGGTLYQDLPSQNPKATIRHSQAAPGQWPTHHVAIKPGSHLASLVGTSSYVNSRHHQAVKDVASELKVTAQAPDGVVEAVESKDSDLILGVQWHPENMWPSFSDQLPLFRDIVKRAGSGAHE
ncbi:gamma-glutamyl-gamma-aminobutyrate hydrolase [Lacticaseibacillus chiayiensis]|uniref:Gamma-glutamyl-gamma-aminobutyrate hydrolase n=1 Tax=Lacticaseibacillus chiayiensis TaxID=2100821 RepID=A0A4Q1UGY8_9LACO|nr:gamma-glutamyl-gamma-aminobutyrate hydrolase family protein [Lacticaseibacillus chiayiensis]QVI35716.1 gamma-glutamyl-gamma-aminobutyrate hydrolase family protein [Lacticaseibacillus chiayiensis]RXT30208.1 gamma-glutamyl-gamma-aminobutyrate hydrolase [Lacticaseibacillus chiayiensis]UYN57551.1 gamma-glutamyl-gamma-aminobutyrate hydrolase family protein [Lacticaseibacillus chiayiensis]